MRPVLVIGLGNPLMGDDGIGCAVAEHLASHPSLPASVEAVAGGSDLLRFIDEVRGRDRILVLDAILDDSEPGSVQEVASVGERQAHAHHLSAVQAARLIELVIGVHITVLGISIHDVRAGEGLSPALAAAIPSIAAQILQNYL
jgi:hydrogenase maturation protease